MENSNDYSKQFQVAEIQLSYKSKIAQSLRPQIKSSVDGYNILLSQWDKTRIEFVEQFKILLLNRANKVIGIFDVSSGSSTGTMADPKLIFAAALKANACGIIASHNHPSGNLKPSQSDIDLTKKLKEAGRFLEIAVLDHLIVTIEGYYSFADNGLM